jgi:hypothetical protein
MRLDVDLVPLLEKSRFARDVGLILYTFILLYVSHAPRIAEVTAVAWTSFALGGYWGPRSDV